VRASRWARVCACVVGMLVGGPRGIGEDSPALSACNHVHVLVPIVPEECMLGEAAQGTQQVRTRGGAAGAALVASCAHRHTEVICTCLEVSSAETVA
jgi:hypothetical protein